MGSTNERGSWAGAGAGAAGYDPSIDYPIKDNWGKLTGHWAHRDRAQPITGSYATWQELSCATYDRNFRSTGARHVDWQDAPASQGHASGKGGDVVTAPSAPSTVPTPPPAPKRSPYQDMRTQETTPTEDAARAKGKSKDKSKDKHKGKSSYGKSQSWGASGSHED